MIEFACHSIASLLSSGFNEQMYFSHCTLSGWFAHLKESSKKKPCPTNIQDVRNHMTLKIRKDLNWYFPSPPTLSKSSSRGVSSNSVVRVLDMRASPTPDPERRESRLPDSVLSIYFKLIIEVKNKKPPQIVSIYLWWSFFNLDLSAQSDIKRYEQKQSRKESRKMLWFNYLL